MIVQNYTPPELLDLGGAALLTLGMKSCALPDCEDCDAERDDPGGSATSA
jgi:hypothetical protein